MAKEYYDHEITPSTDWGGDSSTGGKQVKGSRVQEFIKNQLTSLSNADVEAAKLNPSVFGSFVDNVSLSNVNVGSVYDDVVYDRTRKMFFAVTEASGSTRYHRLFDQFNVWNEGTYPNAAPRANKLYVCEEDVYIGDGTDLVPLNTEDPEATEASVRSIVTDYVPSEDENEEEE